jgi:hypothetical protein
MANYLRTHPLGRFLLFFLPMVATWGVALCAFWPGIMSIDSLDQWAEVLHFSFTDYHPAFHTMTEWLVSGFGSNIAGIAVFQILFLAGVAACGYLVYAKFGVPGAVAGLACGIFTIWPANLFLAITLWKDIPYSASVLAIGIMLLEIIRTRGAWLEKHWWLLGVTAALASLFRHNGIVPGVGTVVLLLFLYAKRRTSILLSLAVLLGIFFAVKYPLYSLVGVRGLEDQQRSIFEMADEMHFLAAQVHNRTDFTPEEAQLLNAIHPLADEWSFYDCHMVDKVYKTSVLRWDIAIQNAGMIHKMVLDTALRSPKASAKHMLCKTELIWNVLPAKYQQVYAAFVEPGEFPNYTYIPPEGSSGIRIAQSPLLPGIGYSLSVLARELTDSPWQALFFRPALLMYLLFIVAAGTALRKREVSYLYVLIPVLLHIAGIILVLPSQQIRYQYPIILIALMVIPLYASLALQKGHGGDDTKNR